MRRASSSKIDRPLVVMVSDRRRYRDPQRGSDPISTLATAAHRAALAGVDMIHIREKDLEAADLLTLTGAVRSAIAGTRTRILINDRLDVALASNADGVHLPANGLPVERVRAISPPGFLVGRSVHSVDEAVEVERRGGGDYLVFGTVFESASKPAGHAVAGLEVLAKVCAAVTLPVLAIGGITLDRVAGVAAAGAAGIAAIGLFATGDEPELIDTVRSIRRAFDTADSGPLDRQP